MNEHRAAESSEVTEGRVVAVKVEGRKILLTRVDGALRACSGKCPHLGLPLQRGKVAGGAITCPFHGSRFDLGTGHNLDWVDSFAGVKMPAWSHSVIALGKKPAPLEMFEAVERDGAVFVRLG